MGDEGGQAAGGVDVQEGGTPMVVPMPYSHLALEVPPSVAPLALRGKGRAGYSCCPHGYRSN